MHFARAGGAGEDGRCEGGAGGRHALLLVLVALAVPDQIGAVQRQRHNHNQLPSISEHGRVACNENVKRRQNE